MRSSLAALLLGPIVLAGCLGDADDLTEQAGPRSLLDDLAPVVERVVQVDGRWSGEPSILALSDGTLLITGAGGMTRYVEDPTDIAGSFGQSYLWRSTDGGATWTFVALPLPAPADQLLPYRNAILGVEGDLAEDEAGRAYFVDLTMLVTQGLSASDDAGKTWLGTQNPVVGLPGTDRPWVAALGDGEVFVKYLQVQTGWRVARSTDGGVSFPEDVAIPPCSQADLAVDPAAGHVLIPCNVGGALSLLRTEAGAPMAWERLEVLDTEGSTSNVFITLAVAGEGHYVLAYSELLEDVAQVKVVTSTDAGATWSDPTPVSPPDVTSVFPWVDASSDGVVGVVWYQADEAGEPAELDAAWHPWHASFRLTRFGDTALAAKRVQLAEEPIHQGAICTSGLGCVLDGRSEDRRLLDFFEVDVDANGSSHVTWTNTQTDVPTIWYGQVGYR